LIGGFFLFGKIERWEVFLSGVQLPEEDSGGSKRFEPLQGR